MHHLISSRQFSTPKQIDAFFQQVDSITPNPNLRPIFDPYYVARGKVMASLFCEPSLRTRFSFETAMARLGGAVVSGRKDELSFVKGETLEDTICTVAEYADVIVLRSGEVGAAERASKITTIPVINAGDGSGEHPTQALLDLYTIAKHRPLNEIKVCICGDLYHGRTVHSLCYLLSMYKEVTIIQASDEALALPGAMTEYLGMRDVKVYYHESLKEALEEKPDVLYMTRLQKERLADWGEPSPLSYHGENWYKFCLSKENIGLVPEHTLILHPGPRNKEISTDLDNDKRCVFRKEQVKNGLKVRMGLLYSIFENKVCYSVPN